MRIDRLQIEFGGAWMKLELRGSLIKATFEIGNSKRVRASYCESIVDIRSFVALLLGDVVVSDSELFDLIWILTRMSSFAEIRNQHV